jgi:hypothetical protein
MTEEFVQPNKPVNESSEAAASPEHAPDELNLEQLSDVGEPLRKPKNEPKTESGNGDLTGETGGSVNP